MENTPRLILPAWEDCLIKAQIRIAQNGTVKAEFNKLNNRSSAAHYAKVYYDEVLSGIGYVHEMLFKSMIMDSDKYRESSAVPSEFHTHYILKTKKGRRRISGLFHYLSPERKDIVRSVVARYFQYFDDFGALLDETIDYQNRKQGGADKGWSVRGSMNDAILILEYVYDSITREYMLGAFQSCISGYTLLHLDLDSLSFLQENLRGRKLSKREKDWLRGVDIAMQCGKSP